MPLGKKTAYIKGQIPKELWNEMKAESALSGQTITTWLIIAINNAITLGKKLREKRAVTSMAKE